MNDNFQLFSNELSRIPCPLCRYSMRLKLSLRLLMTQYKDLCEHCKDKLSFSRDKRCICKEKTRAPFDQEENELYKRIKIFYKSIVPSPKLIHKTKILPFLHEYNPFQSLSVPNFCKYDTKTREFKLADSETNLSGGRPSDDQPFNKYDGEDLKETSDRDYASARDRDFSSARDRGEYGSTRDHCPTRDQDAKIVAKTPGGESQLIGKTMHDLYDKASIAGKYTKDDLKFNLENNIDRLTHDKKGVNADKEKDVSEGKVKKEKDSEKVKKGKDGVKVKYAERRKRVDEGKVNREYDGDKEKQGYEGREKKGKPKAEKRDEKDKEGDEERGKKFQYNEKDIQRSNKDKNEIELDILSFSERRELEKKTGGTHKKKTVHKVKKGKDDDKKMDEQKKKREPSGDEHEPDKEKSKSKKKDAEIDDDIAIPLTYTEDSHRQTVNPFLVRGAKKPKRKLLKKSIGKKSAAASNEKIMTPAVKPKILELIRKLTKTPRIRDKYFDRASSRTSRYLNFDESDRLTSSEKSFLDLLNKPSPFKFHKVIVGNRVIKYKPPMPKFSECEEYSISVKPRIYVKYEEKPAQFVKNRMDSGDYGNENDLGVMCYSLSDRSFISKGYTILPTEKIMRKLNVYRMRPSNPHNDWFARNRQKKTINYTSGQKLAVFEGDDCSCRIYYKNGNVALDYYQAEDNHAQERIVLYSDGENELKQKVPVTVLATFDHMGTGVIFDKKGNIRVKYNQNEGVVLDKTLGPYTKWKWHKLNDPPVLEEIMVDTVLLNKDPHILRMHSKEQLPREVDEKILEIEFQKSLKEKGKKIFKSFKPFPIKMKAFKINDQFSLHIMDQSKIYLAFRDGSTSFRIDVGMILDCNEIIDVETTEMGEVPVPFEHKPARTSSLHDLQRSVEQAQLLERKRLKRNHRQRPLVEPCQNLDRMRSAISQPFCKNIPGHRSDPLLLCSCKNNYNFNENNYVTENN